MKLIIAGGRNIRNHQLMNEAMDYLPSSFDYSITEVVSGCAAGADQLGEDFARDVLEVPITRFSPDWQTHGKKAGILRNQQMADYADVALVLWDGHSKGSLNMIQEMQKRSKPVYVFVVPTDAL